MFHITSSEYTFLAVIATLPSNINYCDVTSSSNTSTSGLTAIWIVCTVLSLLVLIGCIIGCVVCFFCTASAAVTIATEPAGAAGDQFSHPRTVLRQRTRVIAPSVQTPHNQGMPNPVTLQAPPTPPPYQEYPPSFEQSQTEQSTQQTIQ